MRAEIACAGATAALTERSLRCSASCGYSARNTITATIGTSTAPSRIEISRDWTPVPTRLCIARMNSRRAYTLAITTPLKAMIAITSFALKTPSRIRNSPTKFDEPGIASVASETIRNSDASTGARNAIPPISRMSSEPPARWASRAMMNRIGATTSPWLTICSSAPGRPAGSARRCPA